MPAFNLSVDGSNVMNAMTGFNLTSLDVNSAVSMSATDVDAIDSDDPSVKLPVRFNSSA